MDRLIVAVFRQIFSFWEKAVRLRAVSLVLVLLIGNTACGGGKASAPANGALSGNWQISLVQPPSPAPLIYTGFMLNEGNSVAGNLILGSPQCQGVGPVTGTVDGAGNVSLNINEFGQEISLTGTSQPFAGSFSYSAGDCTASAESGTWSAVPVQPLTGSFQGTFTSALTKAVLPVTGTLTQGPNTGNGTASITGTIQSTGNTFCQYISQATISGLISGTTVALNLYGPNGEQITQLGQLGKLNDVQVVSSPGVCGTPGNSPVQDCLLVTPDAKSISGNYLFPTISNACQEDWGTVQFTLSDAASSR